MKAEPSRARGFIRLGRVGVVESMVVLIQAEPARKRCWSEATTAAGRGCGRRLRLNSRRVGSDRFATAVEGYQRRLVCKWVW